MPLETEKYKLQKPTQEETIDIDVINGNMDVLDGVLDELENKAPDINIKKNPYNAAGDVIETHLVIGTQSEPSSGEAEIGEGVLIVGTDNEARVKNSVVLGGTENKVYGDNTFDDIIIGGQRNRIFYDSANTSDSAANHSVIIGGRDNMVCGAECVVLGGVFNKGAGYCGIALGGGNNKALRYQLKTGHWSKHGSAGGESGMSGDAFVIGNGNNDESRSNAFRVGYNGQVYANRESIDDGADYAEFLEWADGNPHNEDRRGLFVTLEGKKIRKATYNDDFILGIISATPGVIGNAASEAWQGMYVTDIFGARICEDVDVEELKDSETGEVLVPAHKTKQWVLSDDYDSSKEYISREYRQEWDTVGMLGQIVTVDDGSCEINGYCRPGDGGVAVASDEKTGYRVMDRIDEGHVLVFVK